MNKNKKLILSLLLIVLSFMCGMLYKEYDIEKSYVRKEVLSECDKIVTHFSNREDLCREKLQKALYISEQYKKILEQIIKQQKGE